MLFGKNPYQFLSEAATQDLFDPATSAEVKDVVDDLQDTLTNNVEEVPEEDMVTNGGVPVTTAESAVLVESSFGRYMVNIESVIAICEDEAAEETGDSEPSVDTVADKATDVVDQIANANGVDPEDVTIVISSESARFLCEAAINESKASKGKKTGKATRKAAILAKVAKALKSKLKVAKAKKK